MQHTEKLKKQYPDYYQLIREGVERQKGAFLTLHSYEEFEKMICAQNSGYILIMGLCISEKQKSCNADFQQFQNSGSRIDSDIDIQK